MIFKKAGMVERAKGGSYKWYQGYSAVIEGKETVPYMTRKECYAFARSWSEKATFID